MRTYLLAGQAFGLLVWILVPGLRADDLVTLKERFTAGYEYHVSTRAEVEGKLSMPKAQSTAKPLNVSGTSSIEYDERTLATDTAGEVQKAVRTYRRIDFQRKVGDQPQHSTLRPQVHRVVLLRLNHLEFPFTFSTDGPLTWSETDLIRTDVFTPALSGLLPDHPVRAGDHWRASSQAVRELTQISQMAEERLDCRLEQVLSIQNRRHARVAFSGMARGINEDGPNRQELEGHLFFDLESNHLSYLYLKGTSFLLDKNNQPIGTVSGRFVVTRQPQRGVPELSEGVLQRLSLDANAENTLLLFDDSHLGVRFLYPRRWHVGVIRGGQLTLDESKGSGLLLTVDTPDHVPTGKDFANEVRAWLSKQHAKIMRMDPATPLSGTAGAEQFTVDMDLGGQRAIMLYVVVRQPSGGATIAARFLPEDYVTLRSDVERVVRSITVTPAATTQSRR